MSSEIAATYAEQIENTNAQLQALIVGEVMLLPERIFKHVGLGRICVLLGGMLVLVMAVASAWTVNFVNLMAGTVRDSQKQDR